MLFRCSKREALSWGMLAAPRWPSSRAADGAPARQRQRPAAVTPPLSSRAGGSRRCHTTIDPKGRRDPLPRWATRTKRPVRASPRTFTSIFPSTDRWLGARRRRRGVPGSPRMIFPSRPRSTLNSEMTRRRYWGWAGQGRGHPTARRIGARGSGSPGDCGIAVVTSQLVIRPTSRENALDG